MYFGGCQIDIMLLSYHHALVYASMKRKMYLRMHIDVLIKENFGGEMGVCLKIKGGSVYSELWCFAALWLLKLACYVAILRQLLY